MLVVPALILAAMMWFVLATARPTTVNARAGRIDEAVEIVRDRFARGEIDAAEYNRLVTGLTSFE